jgi:hypothetical protein
MKKSPCWRQCMTLFALAAALAPAGTVLAADAAPRRFALDVDPGIRTFRKQDASENVSRRLVTHLVPMIEAMGYTVTQVKEAEEAVRKGGHHASIAVNVKAAPIYLVHESRVYGKTVVADYDTGVSATGTFRVYGGPERKLVAYGDIEPIDSQVHEAGGRGRPMFDDEDAVARRYAQVIAEIITETLR